jgi:predicted RNA methylase
LCFEASRDVVCVPPELPLTRVCLGAGLCPIGLAVDAVDAATVEAVDLCNEAGISFASSEADVGARESGCAWQVAGVSLECP